MNLTIHQIIKFKKQLLIFQTAQQNQQDFFQNSKIYSNILIDCANNFLFGKSENYTLPIFECSTIIYKKF